MSEHWTERLTTQLRREVVRVDHNAEHHAIAAFLKRKTRPNAEARFPLATFIRIVRGWGNYPVRYTTLIDVLEARPVQRPETVSPLCTRASAPMITALLALALVAEPLARRFTLHLIARQVSSGPTPASRQGRSQLV